MGAFLSDLQKEEKGKLFSQRHFKDNPELIIDLSIREQCGIRNTHAR